ncbi:hypothetical protein BOX15_Mlig012439g1 [Macrostomum lignano]|uniref:Uncharacterized protein n=1 Tax=Macrostomum lignano TaxID=282301 RepID=A0A267H330_9PLAT|nr:hypothetical protein BOX15_Mlig012439g1 [Macrostomum lignano]
MAASIAMMTPQQMGAGGGAGGGGAFSPLTLFECTITNATMLIDSMAARDLMVAFKIVTQLNSHLVEAMEPQFVRIADTADAHARCPPPPPPPTANIGSSGSRGGNSAMKMQQQPSSSGAVADFMSAGSLKREYNSDDDCQILDDDASGSMFGSFDIVGAPGGSGAAFGASAGSPAKIARTSGGDLSDTGELSAEWKGILRKAYRQLKDETGSNVFDFSLPYSAPVNMEAAKKVIDKALQITSYKPTNIAAWTIAIQKYTGTYYRDTLRKSYSLEANRLKSNKLINTYSKLNRRQKAYDSLKPTLDSAARERYESVLNRDFTSSDEECGADLDSEMRVKQLPWESDELRDMKHRLDQLFHDNLADEKQRGEMTRLRRDPACRSSRPPPSECPGWAKRM